MLKNTLTEYNMTKLQKIINDAAKKVGSLRKLSALLNIPYSTLRDWKLNRRKPNLFTQDAVIQKINELIENNN